MKTIPVSGGKAFATVDDEDYERLSRLSWFLSNKGYAIASTHVDGKIVNFYMHRLVAGTPIGAKTDHRDGNRLNNCRLNLRTCTVLQNNMNKAKRQHCSSVQKGVYWCKQKGKWHARIKIGGKAKHLGFFSDEVAAGAAYNAAAKNLFGEFARLNTI
ncbi:hypothetical protein ACI2T7_03285 [Ralstonia nicotianae]